MTTSGPQTPPPDDLSPAAGSGPGDRIRASNADREAVINRLNTAFGEGRLDVTELDERVAAAYAAKTVGELRPLTRDLPAEPPAEPSPTSATSTKSPAAAAGEWVNWVRVAVPSVVIVCFLVWAATSVLSEHWIYPWWIWVVVAWGCGAFGGRHHHRRR